MKCLNRPLFMQGLTTWRPLAHIPNKAGYEFIGRTHQNLEIFCKVVLKHGFHTVSGCGGFQNLRDWRPIEQYDKEALSNSL